LCLKKDIKILLTCQNNLALDDLLIILKSYWSSKDEEPKMLRINSFSREINDVDKAILPYSIIEKSNFVIPPLKTILDS
jgi:hypothetical protein